MKEIMISFENIEILFASYCNQFISNNKLRFSERKMLSDIFNAMTKEQKEIVENKCKTLIDHLEETGFIN
ncbi:hypothetical protein P4H56_28400 [Bacillus cereus]|uniref:hypothetical protein n=1 Tax=Bacillus thuringiensis TaxID=1428 RepID=UPI001F26C416|nr:hypothetical protein [Bacillus thuringiensis]MEB8829854.1 hypothetical protein [Bacillus cereus]MCE9706602.1 hypothetical protein [Bacillus thuringiensis]MED2208153.1 hypothetical protein [Bacillus thuringiensis]MED2698607.1 hypothetical protein [Bacillus thuringiensis]UJT50220.1 hypothetical protein GFH33_31565 [Bacillus thuringiensis]